MRTAAVLLSLLFAAGAAAADTGCVAPDFPEVSKTDKSVRAVTKQVKAWRSCIEKAGEGAEAGQAKVQVEAGLEKWLAATNAHFNGQARSNRTVNRLEDDHRAQVLQESRDRVK